MRTAVKFLLTVLLFTFVFVPLLALAQDAGVVLPSDIDSATPSDAFAALQHIPPGALGVAFVSVLVLMAATWLLRKFGSKLPGALGVAFGSPIASWVLPVVFSFAGALGTSLSAGLPITVNTVLGALLVAIGAGGAFSKAMGGAKVAAAEAAGAAAAAAPASKADKLDGLTK